MLSNTTLTACPRLYYVHEDRGLCRQSRHGQGDVKREAVERVPRKSSDVLSKFPCAFQDHSFQGRHVSAIGSMRVEYGDKGKRSRCR